MHQTFAVRGGQASPREPKHAQHLPPRGSAWQPSIERLAVDQLHRDEHPVADRTHLVHRDHVWMTEPGQGAGLLQQAFIAVGRLATATARRRAAP